MTALALLPPVDDAPHAHVQLGDRIIALAGRLAAATCRWLLLVAEFDAQDGAATYGLPTTARWLAFYCGVSRRTALDHVRVARTLAAHPELVTAMSAGQVSFSHARAIARAAELGEPALVDSLIEVAAHGTVSHLEDIVRGLRHVDDVERDAPEPSRQTFSHRWRDDSRLGVSAALDPERGAVLLSAVDAVAAREGLTQPEALVRMAEIALTACRSTATSGASLPALRGDEHAAVVVHVDARAAATALSRSAERDGTAPPEPDGTAPSDADGTGSAEPAEPASSLSPLSSPSGRVANGPGLPWQVVERLACSGRVRLITYDPRVAPGETSIPLDVGASRRLVSARQFRALLLRDRGCAYPGCLSRLNFEAHHVVPWSRGGPTVMANLILLCRRHHHAHHAGEFVLERAGRRRVVFSLPDGTELGRARTVWLAATTRSAVKLEDEHPTSARAATSRWDGRRLDHRYAIATLSQHLASVAARRAPAVSRRE